MVGCDGPSRPVLLSRSPGRSSGGSPVMAGSSPVCPQAYSTHPPSRLRLSPHPGDHEVDDDIRDHRHTSHRHTAPAPIRRTGVPTR
ncbi:hypothetical protein FXF50_25145 [Micromonospora sp. AP08]|nr:hypothetical protein FXF50_25145 [Micromonospora sp. AP08]